MVRARVVHGNGEEKTRYAVVTRVEDDGWVEFVYCQSSPFGDNPVRLDPGTRAHASTNIPEVSYFCEDNVRLVAVSEIVEPVGYCAPTLFLDLKEIVLDAHETYYAEQIQEHHDARMAGANPPADPPREVIMRAHPLAPED